MFLSIDAKCILRRNCKISNINFNLINLTLHFLQDNCVNNVRPDNIDIKEQDTADKILEICDVRPLSMIDL